MITHQTAARWNLGIEYFISYFTMDPIIHPFWDKSYTLLVNPIELCSYSVVRVVVYCKHIFYRYPIGLFYWHCYSRMITQMLVNECWMICYGLHEFTKNAYTNFNHIPSIFSLLYAWWVLIFSMVSVDRVLSWMSFYSDIIKINFVEYNQTSYIHVPM